MLDVKEPGPKGEKKVECSPNEDFKIRWAVTQVKKLGNESWEVELVVVGDNMRKFIYGLIVCMGD